MDLNVPLSIKDAPMSPRNQMPVLSACAKNKFCSGNLHHQIKKKRLPVAWRLPPRMDVN